MTIELLVLETVTLSNTRSVLGTVTTIRRRPLPGVNCHPETTSPRGGDAHFSQLNLHSMTIELLVLETVTTIRRRIILVLGTIPTMQTFIWYEVQLKTRQTQ